MEEQSVSGWSNFATGGIDYIAQPATDEQARQYIPQNAPAQALYGAYRDSGKDILHAIIGVLEIWAGVVAPK